MHRSADHHRCGNLALPLGLMLSSVILATAAQAQSDKPTGFSVLTIGGGARAIGLAETMAADGDDPFVIEYNPAGLTKVDRFTVSFAHNKYFLDTRGEYLAAAVPLGRWAAGVRVGYVGTDDIPLRDGPSEQPLGLYGASDGIFQGAIAGPIDERLSVGVSAAWVVEHIDVESAEAVALGAGILYKLQQRVMLGVAFTNVGPPTKFIEREFKLPNLMRAGTVVTLADATARAEMVVADNDNVKWHLGGEYAVDPRIAIRAGVKVGYDTQWLAAGFGAKLPDGRLGVDYAYAPYTDDLGTTHRFGITVRP